MAIPISRSLMSIGVTSSSKPVSPYYNKFMVVESFVFYTECSTLLNLGRVLSCKPISFPANFSTEPISVRKKICYPQPTPETHPKLLKEGEVMNLTQLL